MFKYILSIAFLALMVAGCTKEDHDDISFATSGNAPEKLSSLFEITQDNTGMVTITPNGTGAAYYNVYFGDSPTAFAKVEAGKSVTHKYAEGVYTVKLQGHSVTGKVTESTQQLTVSFKAPENVEATITVDPNNSMKISVQAKAQYETNFKVYFGDVPNEVPVTFLEGESVTHTYAAVGTYDVKVVALSGGAASAEIVKPVTIVNPVLLPITFESATVDYSFIGFGGGAVTKVDNPQPGGINTSSKVGKMVKGAPEGWAGAVITLGAPINFSANKVFRLKVYSPRVGAKVLLKVENLTDGTKNYEKEVATTTANAWEELGFDFSAINTANSYQKVVLIFDLGTPGDGSANYTYYFDDINLTSSMPNESLTLPLTFESPTLNYAFTGFDGGNVTVINNPQSGGGNTSSKVARMVKGAGQTWGGAFISLSEPINFSANKVFRMKVFSPRVGAKVLLKVENKTDNSKNFEKEVTTTVANAWEDLAFDYTAINTANAYQNVVLIFDNGTAGDGTANFTFLFDDIRLTNAMPAEELALPLTFESSTLAYAFTNFDGGAVTVVSNPQSSGINTSAKVAQMVKGAGQPWGGAYITLDGPIDFSTQKTMKMKVFSPRVGAKVLLKVENATDNTKNFEKEVTTTVANAWEELTFDYSAINTANEYHKVVLIFDNGTTGDGSANFTYLFDDIKLN
ncbi:MAG TPA: PKD domain-containing protein [Chitinophagaceae bacterium]